MPEVFFFPMSFAQQRLWFLDQLDPGSPTYNIPGVVRLRGRLDIPALKRSLNETIRRHESLRTSFNTLEGQPVQVITPSLELDLTVTSLEDVLAAERGEVARQLVTTESQQPFDLKQPPLLRVALLRLEEQDHIFVLTMHHIISDGWSIGILLGELTTLYAAYVNGQPSPLQELPIQYADYAVWQRGWLQGEVLEKQLAYWKGQLGGDLPVLRFPTDYSRPAVPTYRGAYYPLSIPQRLTDSLKALSQQAGVTLFMTLLAAFNALLHRYTGQVDIIVGTPIANRNRSETEGLIGFFANTLAVRTDLSGNPRFLDLLERTHKVMVGAYAHQDLPFEKIVEELQPERTVGSNPLFQVTFLMLNALPSNISWPGITFEPWELNWTSVKFDLEFHLSEVADSLTCNVAYNRDLFEESSIASLARHYRNLLEAIVAAPETRIAGLPLLTADEQRQLLDSSGILASDSATYPTLPHSFAAQAARTPDLPAVIFQDQSLTFRQLDERSNQLAHHLQSLGVTSGDVVGLLLERSLDLVVALLATLKTGATVMPLESSAPPSRWARLLAQSPVRMLLTTQHLSAQLLSARTDLPRLLNLDTAAVSLAAESTEPLSDGPTLESNAYLMALAEDVIAITGQSVQRRLCALQEMFELREGEVVLHKASFESDIWVWELLWPLCFGGYVVVAPPAVDHVAILRLLSTHGVNVTHAVASELKAWVVAAEQEVELSQRAKLRWVLSSGEAAPHSVLERWQRLSNGKVAQLYGVPEAGAELLVSLAANHSASAESLREQSESTPIEGRAVTSGTLLVLDQAGQLVPVGVSGEICVGGSVLNGAYQWQSQLANQRLEQLQAAEGRPRLVSNPYHEIGGANLLRTGDCGRWLKDGRLRVEGQFGKAAWIDGYRIIYADVETALLDHKAIEECAVRARRTARGTQLVAYIVQNSAIANEHLQQWLAERLPAFLVSQVYVEMKALPLTASGELDEAALLEIPIVDEQQLREFEERLRGVEDIIDVALIEQETEDDDTLLHGDDTLPDWFYRQVWRPKRARRIAMQLAPATVLIFLDEAGLGAHLCTQLKQLGSTCITVTAGSEFRQESSLDYHLDPGTRAHYEQLFKALVAGGLFPKQVLHLWTHDVPEQTDLDSLMAAQQRGFYSVLWLAQELAQAVGSSAMRLLVVTAETQPSRSGVLRAYHHATLPGLIASMRLEFPWLQCRHLDLEQDAAEPNAKRVMIELMLDRAEAEVSYRDGSRLVPRLQKIDMSNKGQQPLPLKRGGLYLITGGRGGIGSYLARHLIRHYGVKLLLIGRTLLANEQTQCMHDIEEADTDACLYRATYVCDLAGLRRAVREAEEHWATPLDGVFHLAGEENLARHWRQLNEYWIVAQQKEQVAAALQAKVQGTWTLYELLREHEGAFFVGFSSVSSVFGAATFAPYAAANSFLDGYVQYQQARGVVRSWCFDWTMWDEIGMSAGGPTSMREVAQTSGYRVIGAKQGVQSLLAGLSLPPARLLVGLDASHGQVSRVMENSTLPSRKLVAYFTSHTNDLPVSRLRDLVAKNGRLACEFVQIKEMPRTESGEIDRRELAVLLQHNGRLDHHGNAPRTDLEKQLVTIWTQVLGVKQLGIHDSFFKLGGHSLLAIQLISQINKTFKVELTLAKLFEAPTIASVAELLVQLEAEPGQVAAVVRLRKQLNEMSPDEIKAALRARQQQIGV